MGPCPWMTRVCPVIAGFSDEKEGGGRGEAEGRAMGTTVKELGPSLVHLIALGDVLQTKRLAVRFPNNKKPFKTPRALSTKESMYVRGRTLCTEVEQNRAIGINHGGFDLVSVESE